MDVVVVPLAGATTMSAGPKAPEGLHAAPVTNDEGAAAEREHKITTGSDYYIYLTITR